MKIESSLPLFNRTNDKLDRLAINLKRAHDARDGFDLLEPGVIRASHAVTIGWSLQHIYRGIEGILKDVARTIDGENPVAGEYVTIDEDPPYGMTRHCPLLDQVTTPTPARPAVIDEHPELRGLMKFKYFIKNSYDHPPADDEVLEKLRTVDETVLPKFLTGLERLRDFLESG